MRCPSEFERAPYGGADEIAVYEAYLEAGFRVGVPSIVAEVSSLFGFCPSQLTPLTWRTLMAIQVLGEFHGFVVGVHEILYSYYFAPLVSKPRFYHLRSRDGTPLVKEPSRGIKDLSRPVSFIGEVVAKLVLEVPQRFRDRKRRPSYTPPLRLVRAASSVSGPPSVSLTGAEASFNRISPMAIHQRLLTELFFLRNQVRGMAFHRDQSVLQAKATAIWELMKEWLEKRVEHWNPEEEYHRYLFWAEGVDQLMGGEPIQAATPGSAAGSRYSGDPSF
ncbi:hypothetical protein F2Q69_00006863 [Brassica cretica]|uniref:Uncharacterized protein n=1 Tax=Brassica cretica TaxID=69181 RepID=A0A8S9PFE5_BRACR|nr:hypothetical protein F2Q69_00006863 [Brassica cretica]